MSDQNKFVNAYIDVSMATVHDFQNQLIQTKAQLKVANDTVAEKDGVISSLQTELETEKNNRQDLNNAIDNANRLESECHSLRTKASDYDVLAGQYGKLKSEYKAKLSSYDQIVIENNKLKERLKELSKFEKLAKKEEKKSIVVPPNRNINKETKLVSVPLKTIEVVDKKIEQETDDF